MMSFFRFTEFNSSPEPEKMGLGSNGGGTGQDVARRLMSKYGWQEGQGYQYYYVKLENA